MAPTVGIVLNSHRQVVVPYPKGEKSFSKGRKRAKGRPKDSSAHVTAVELVLKTQHFFFWGGVGGGEKRQELTWIKSTY